MKHEIEGLKLRRFKCFPKLKNIWFVSGDRSTEFCHRVGMRGKKLDKLKYIKREIQKDLKRKSFIGGNYIRNRNLIFINYSLLRLNRKNKPYNVREVVCHERVHMWTPLENIAYFLGGFQGHKKWWMKLPRAFKVWFFSSAVRKEILFIIFVLLNLWIFSLGIFGLIAKYIIS